jgi:hypothetical protein
VPDDITAAVRHWLESVVIGLNLCPFARRELLHGRVRFAVSDATSEVRLLQALEAELEHLAEDAATETSLLVHPNVLQDFADYNQFLQLADGLLVQMRLDGVFQIASFHPDYQFAGTNADDAENYTNRSPYPMLHLLREDSLSRVIESTIDIDQIPLRNIRKMNQLGAEKLKLLFGR